MFESEENLPQGQRDSRQTDSVGKISWSVLRNGVPTMGTFTFSLGVVSLGFIVPHLPTREEPEIVLAATGLIVALTNEVTMAAISPCYAIGVRASVAFGKLKDHPQEAECIARFARAGVFIGLSLGGALLPILYLPDRFLQLFGVTDEAILSLVKRYLEIYAPALLITVMRVCAEQVLFAAGKPKLAAICGLASLSTALTFGCTLAFHYEMGLTGLAYGFLSEALLAFISMTSVVLLHPKFKDVPFVKIFVSRYNTLIKDMVDLFYVGFSVTLQVCGKSTENLLVAVFAGQLGTIALAAQNFVTQLGMLAGFPIFGFGLSLVPEVGRRVGDKQFINASRYARFGMLTSLVVTAPFCIAVAIHPEMLTKLINSTVNSEVMDLVRWILPTASIGYLCGLANFLGIHTSRQSNDNYMPTLISTFMSLGLGVLTFHFISGSVAELNNSYGLNISRFVSYAFVSGMLLNRWWQNTDPDTFTQVSMHQANTTLDDSVWERAKSCASSVTSFAGSCGAWLWGDTAEPEFDEARQEAEPLLTPT